MKKLDRKILNCNRVSMRIWFVLACSLISASILIGCAGNNSQKDKTELRERGYSLIPAPQEVEINGADIAIDESWCLNAKVDEENMAVKSLKKGAEKLHELNFSESGQKNIVLKVQSGAVKSADDPKLNNQGYKLQITSNQVSVIGNTKTGLFYGVQSLLQLLKPNQAGDLELPQGEIRDWPSLEMRVVHWDTKHHQKRMPTMKRLIDWLAFFKVNTISFEITDKYEFPSHPTIGAPGAYTQAEMQELTKYAMDRNIQLIPNVQSPAHMTYALKHEKFADLRSDGSNYQIDLCDPKAVDLVFDMYQDLINATPGVDYFHVSTDEIYYAGISENCQRPYNEKNRSLAWAEYTNKAHDWLAERDRRMIAWVEYPLLAEDISKLSPDIIDGVGSGETFLKEEEKMGIRQWAYSSMQGTEKLFPNYFSVTDFRGEENEGRLKGASQTIIKGTKEGAEYMGTFAAFWGDSGLHEETSLLGWATVTQFGWTPHKPSVKQNAEDFMNAYYGYQSPDMIPVYKLLQQGATLFDSGWDNIKSRERKLGYGNHRGPGIGAQFTDRVLSLPEIPPPGTLDITDIFSECYSTLIEAAETMKKNNNELLNRLSEYKEKVERNRYNIEVFQTIGQMERLYIRMILTLRDVENVLQEADAASTENPKLAVEKLVEASNQVEDYIRWADTTWGELKTTWQKSRFERGRSVNGRDYVRKLSDVKDHLPDRRNGLDYMLAPFQRLDLPGWRSKLNNRIENYAKDHQVKVEGLKDQQSDIDYSTWKPLDTSIDFRYPMWAR